MADPTTPGGGPPAPPPPPESRASIPSPRSAEDAERSAVAAKREADAAESSAESASKMRQLYQEIELSLKSREDKAKAIGQIEASFARELLDLLKERQRVQREYENELTKAETKYAELLEYRSILGEGEVRNKEILKERLTEELKNLTVGSEKYNEKAKILEIINAGGEETLNQLNKEIGIAEGNLRVKKEALIVQDKLLESSTKLNKSFSELGNLVLKTNKLTDSFSGSLVTSVQLFVKGLASGETKLKDLGASIANFFKFQLSPEQVFGGLLKTIEEQTLQAAFALDEMQANFNKTTGRGKEFQEAILGDGFKVASAGLAAYGIGITELGNAYGKLYENFNAFSGLNQQTQIELSKFAAKMENVGVSVETTANLLTKLTNSLKMSKEGVQALEERLVKVAAASGISTTKIVGDFERLLPKLIGYGVQAEDVFIRLEKASKSVGLSVDSLIAVTDKFDTFQSAADSVGQLNAILGGSYLNSLDMVSMREDERVLAINRAFEATGRSFDQLNKYQQRAIATAAGFKDAAEASNFFGKSSAELTIAMAAQEKEQKAIADLEKQSIPVKKQMNKLMEEFIIILKPVIGAMQSFTQALVKLDEETNGKFLPTLAAILGIIGLLVIGFKAVTAAAGAFAAVSGVTAAIRAGGGLLKVSRAISRIGDAAPIAGNGMANMGNTAGNSSAGLLRFAQAAVAVGIAALGIGVGIGVAAWGVSLLVKAFSGMSPEQIYAISAALVVFGVTIVAFAVAISGSIEFLGVAALGILAIGGSIAVAAVGIAGGIYLIAKAASVYRDSQTEATKAQTELNKSMAGLPELSVIQAKFDAMAAGIKKVADAAKGLKDVKTELTALSKAGGVSVTMDATKVSSVAEETVSKVSSGLASTVSSVQTIDRIVRESSVFSKNENAFAPMEEKISGSSVAIQQVANNLSGIKDTTALVAVADTYKAMEAMAAVPPERLIKPVEVIKATKELLTAKTTVEKARTEEIIKVLAAVQSGAGTGTVTLPDKVTLNAELKVEMKELSEKIISTTIARIGSGKEQPLRYTAPA